MSKETAAAPAAPQDGEPRCEVCHWPLAESADKGCVPGNCSYRPHEGTPEYFRIQQNRARLAAQSAPARPAPEALVAESILKKLPLMAGTFFNNEEVAAIKAALTPPARKATDE